MNAADYDAFVADSGGIIGYTASNVDMPNKEIEHIGISAIVDVLLKPVNLSIEIAYLDLSPGNATNIYRFPNNNPGQDAASMANLIYLLYRPTHYDVLYRTPPVHTLSGAGQMSNPFSVQVHRVRFTDAAAIASTQGDLDMYGNVDYETLAMIPGFGGSSMSMPGPALGPTPSMSESFSPTPQNSAWSQFTNPFGPGSEPSNQILSPERVPPIISAAPVPAAVDLMPSQRKLSQPSPEPRPRPVERTASSSSLGGGGVSIRFSPLQFQYDEGKEKFPDMTFQVTTNTFKNSVWNRAHFGNPDFHPEEWSPEDENIDGRLASRKKSR
jgi:ubiquitin thioesterase protein OTUB1